MTPGAFAMAKRMLDVKSVPADERAHWRGALSEAHFFECTKVLPLVEVLFDGLHGDQREFERLQDRYRFLPAPKTWIEFVLKDEGGFLRCAIVLTGLRRDDWITYCWDEDYNPAVVPREFNSERETFVALLLIIINQPQVVCRRSHDPHRGLARELLKNQKMIGKFPLRAWTEIKLEISIPPTVAAAASVETRLTGQKCLHFVRSHRREFLDGSWTTVESHWRGNPALGIKQSRYSVEPSLRASKNIWRTSRRLRTANTEFA